MGELPNLVGLVTAVMWHIYQVSSCGFHRKPTIAICKFEYMYFEVRVWGKGYLDDGGIPRMHTMYGLNRAGHLHLDR